MLVPTHVTVVVFLCLYLNLDRNEWLIAIMFGVLLDIDHLFAMPRYVSHDGWAAILHRSWDDGSGLPWKSLLHYPVGAFVVAPLSVGWRFLLPLSFWALHLSMDYAQNALGWLSTPVESALLVSSSAGIFALLYRNWSEAHPEGDLKGFVQAMRAGLADYGSAIKRRIDSIV